MQAEVDVFQSALQKGIWASLKRTKRRITPSSCSLFHRLTTHILRHFCFKHIWLSLLTVASCRAFTTRWESVIQSSITRTLLGSFTIVFLNHVCDSFLLLFQFSCVPFTQEHLNTVQHSRILPPTVLHTQGNFKSLYLLTPLCRTAVAHLALKVRKTQLWKVVPLAFWSYFIAASCEVSRAYFPPSSLSETIYTDYKSSKRIKVSLYKLAFCIQNLRYYRSNLDTQIPLHGNLVCLPLLVWFSLGFRCIHVEFLLQKYTFFLFFPAGTVIFVSKPWTLSWKISETIKSNCYEVNIHLEPCTRCMQLAALSLWVWVLFPFCSFLCFVLSSWEIWIAPGTGSLLGSRGLPESGNMNTWDEIMFSLWPYGFQQSCCIWKFWGWMCQTGALRRWYRVLLH